MIEVKIVDTNNSLLNEDQSEVVGKIESPAQQKLYKQLKKYNNEVANTYRGALIVLMSKDNPDRFKQSAHSLRLLSGLIVRDIIVEDKSDNRAVTDIVLDWLNSYSKNNPPTYEEIDSFKKKLEIFTLNHIKKMILMIRKDDPMGGPPEHVIRQITREWNDLHNFFNRVAKTGNTTESDFKNHLSEMELILFNITSSYYDNRDQIEKVLNKKPSVRLAKELSKMIVSYRSYEYLFERASSDWLTPLRGVGFFVLPEQSLRIWPPSKYLLRIIAEKPEEIVGIVNSFSDTSNPAIIDDIINMALNVDIKYTLEIIKIIFQKKWVINGFFGDNYWSGHNVYKLIDYLVKNNKADAALKLFQNFLSFDKETEGVGLRSAKPHIRVHDYRDLLDKHIDSLVEIKPTETIEVIAKFLNATYLKIYTDAGGKRVYSRKEDYSYLDYKDIEEGMYHLDSATIILLRSLINLLENVATNNHGIIFDCMDKLNYPLYIFRMIKLRMYNKFPSLFKGEIKSSLLKSENYEDINDIGEVFSELVVNNFKLLNNAEKEKVFKITEKCPKYILELRDITQEQIDEFFERWRYKNLYLVKAFLNGDSKVWFDSVKDKYSPPDFTKGLSTTWVGPTSDITVTDFNSMDPDVIIRELDEWIPPKGSMVDTPEGRGRNLSESIKFNPNKYFPLALEFIKKKLRFTYIHHLFWGFELAHREKHPMDWDKIIDAGINLVRLDKDNIDKFPKTSNDDFEYDHDGAVRSLLSLIDQGLGQKEIDMPVSRRGDIWEIIKKGTKSTYPDLEHEKEYGGNNMDPFTMSINTTRGEAMHALIRYASWIVQQSKEKRGLPKEVLQVLNYHLDYKNDPTETIHCIYGRYLPFLSHHEPEWVKKNMKLIFPDEKEKFLVWKATFGTYLRGNMYIDLFSELFGQYSKAIEYVSTIEDEKNEHDHFVEALANHIALALVYNAENATSIAEKLFKAKNDRLKKHIVFYIGANILKPDLRNMRDKKYADPEKVKWIWEKIINELSPDVAEGFGYWFINSPFDKRFTIDQLVETLRITRGQLDGEYQIHNKLNDYVDDYPTEVFECIELIIRGDPHKGRLFYRITEYVGLMRKIKDRADKELIIKMSKLADYLGKNGFENEFEEFK
ncbi:MAG: hypothetical protein ACKKL6_00605 [Candidatus Komeilibacteria bacterium]